MRSGFQGESIRHGGHHLAFSSSARCFCRARCRAGGSSPTATYDQANSRTMFELRDAHVDATGFLAQVTLVFGGMGVPTLRQSE